MRKGFISPYATTGCVLSECHSELTLALPAKVIDGDKTMEPMVPFPGGRVEVHAPGAWTLPKSLSGVTLTPSDGGFVLEVPAGARKVTAVHDD